MKYILCFFIFSLPVGAGTVIGKLSCARSLRDLHPWKNFLLRFGIGEKKWARDMILRLHSQNSSLQYYRGSPVNRIGVQELLVLRRRMKDFGSLLDFAQMAREYSAVENGTDFIRIVDEAMAWAKAVNDYGKVFPPGTEGDYLDQFPELLRLQKLLAKKGYIFEIDHRNLPYSKWLGGPATIERKRVRIFFSNLSQIPWPLLATSVLYFVRWYDQMASQESGLVDFFFEDAKARFPGWEIDRNTYVRKGSKGQGLPHGIKSALMEVSLIRRISEYYREMRRLGFLRRYQIRTLEEWADDDALTHDIARSLNQEYGLDSSVIELRNVDLDLKKLLE